MDYKELNEKWPSLKSKIQQEHPHLTDDDLAMETGREEDTVLRLAEKLKKNRKEMDNWLSLLG